jgi:hypothetical protein
MFFIAEALTEMDVVHESVPVISNAAPDEELDVDAELVDDAAELDEPALEVPDESPPDDPAEAAPLAEEPELEPVAVT